MAKPHSIEEATRGGYIVSLEFIGGPMPFQARLFWPGALVAEAHSDTVYFALLSLENEMARLGWPEIERRRNASEMYKPKMRAAENGSARGRGQGWLGILLQPLRNAFRR